MYRKHIYTLQIEVLLSYSMVNYYHTKHKSYFVKIFSLYLSEIIDHQRHLPRDNYNSYLLLPSTDGRYH
jgi:hypothetical protein